jgi:ankyrin repeat protein
MTDKMWDGAAYGRMNVVVSELEAGADINAADSDGWTTLLIAAKEGFPEIATFAISKGADVKAVKKGGFNALHLLTQGLGANPPTAKVEAFQPILKAMIEGGADVNGKTEGGEQTPLWIAARHAQTECVRALLLGKADHSIACSTGSRPLQVAALGGDLGVVKQLLEAGAEVGAVDAKGFSALHAACEVGNLEMCKTLVEAGADSTLKTTEALEDVLAGSSCIDIAKRYATSEVVDWLNTLPTK